MERLTAVVVLVLGGLVMPVPVASVALGQWETTLAKVLVLLPILVTMWRASGHLQPSPHAR